ncbi:MAG TPA: DNA-formamidopyrimidine glycosylase family protein [Homoserinimonas sp.]|nr:DNA-formamidopyrimidine glycosylase family protein [Homoserinimonas sp.]
MPEGHSVHRIARQFALHFVGRRVAASSPQGRFAAGAAELDGQVMTASTAIGKQLYLDFEHDRVLRVHLGIYGAWDFAGDVTADAAITSAAGRIGQTGMHGTVVGEYEDSLGSIGAPRRTRLRMAEQEILQEAVDTFPPDPIGQVRVRLLTDVTVADLRGPTACEVLSPGEADAIIARLGPDPLTVDPLVGEARFVAAVRKKATPIGVLLMDQSVVAGIGNVYRAELLFRANLNPFTPGKLVPEDTLRQLWQDWTYLLNIGVETGQMLTMDGLEADAYRAALASRDDRHWVYRRAGLPCRVCGTHIAMELAAARKLYWCPRCQA